MRKRERKLNYDSVNIYGTGPVAKSFHNKISSDRESADADADGGRMQAKAILMIRLWSNRNKKSGTERMKEEKVCLRLLLRKVEKR